MHNRFKNKILHSIILLLFLLTNHFSLSAAKVGSVNDLPLRISTTKGSNETLILYLSGDGGWNKFTESLIGTFENHGYGFVALSTRKYFWDEKSPETFARDMEEVASHYLTEWNKTSLIIIGYSFGADVGSFLTNRFSAGLKKKVKKIVLLSPSSSSDFVIRLTDLIGVNESFNRKYLVQPEIEKIGIPVVCIFGQEEIMLLKKNLLKDKNVSIHDLPGDHQYQNNFALLLKTMGL